MPSIVQAEVADAAAILDLQKLCFRSEAELNNEFNIPPLVQTLAELEREFETHHVLKIVIDGEIAGSVRGTMVEDMCRVGRLIVHPRFQKQGLGTKLMAKIESEFAGAIRFEIFTGSRSVSNLRLYERLGYHETRRVAATDTLTLVYLQKP